MASRTPIAGLVKKFFETDPTEAIRSLETLSEGDVVGVLNLLPPSLSSQVFTRLQPHVASALVGHIPENRLPELLSLVDPQQGATILMNLAENERQRFVNHLPEQTKTRMGELLSYPIGSAGRIMTTEFLAFRTDVKAKDAVLSIRSIVRKNVPVTYTYVVNDRNHLVGVLNMRDLLLAQGDVPLESVMRKDVFTVNAMMDREEIAHQLSERRFLAAPVVDHEGRLLGVVKSDQLLGHIQEEATEDIQKMVGAGGDERAFSPISFSLRKRLPWLHVNLATAFLAAWVVSLFEDIIAKITVLAVFLPVVAGQGGNAGAQSLAVVMRALVMREIPSERVWKLVLKESGIGILNGLIIGSVTAIVVWFWHGNPYLGLVIALAMIVNLLAAGFSGAAIPIVLKALGRDPAQASSIILTTITDVVGFFVFLGFAVVFQQHL